MRRSRLHKLIDEKLELLDTSPKVFDRQIKAIQKTLFEATLKILDQFSLKNGRIDTKDKSNASILSTLNTRLNNILKRLPLKSATGKLLRSFDKIEGLNKEVLEGVNKIDLSKFNLNTEKKQAVEDILEGLLVKTNSKGKVVRNSLSRAIINPVRAMLYRHITLGISKTQARQELKAFIQGDDSLGYMQRYARQITQDALIRYDRTINQKAAVEFDLDGFRYVNSLIANSRPFCKHMVNHTGFAKDLAINGKYRVSDIPKIIAAGERLGNGWIRGTNPSNFFINVGGYGCRHILINTIILDRDTNRDSFDENVEEDIDEINT